MKVGKTNSYSCVVYTKSCVLKSLNDKFEICARKIGVFFRFLAFGVISFEYREIGERYARYVSSLTNKQTKGRKFEIFASVSYRSNTGREKKRIWERYNGHFEQVQVKFYQLFATTIRWWSLAKIFFQNAKKGLKC